MIQPYLDAFVPVFGLLVLGFVLKRRLLPEDAVWLGIERLTFWVLLPALLVASIGGTRLAALPLAAMVLTLWPVLVLGFALGLGLALGSGAGPAAATSVLQGGTRFNNLMGFAICGALYGTVGTALGAVATGMIVPFVQVCITIAFALLLPGAPAAAVRGRLTPFRLLRLVLANPLVLGCATGFAVAMAGGLPPGLRPLLGGLGQAAVALGLLCVGAALSGRTLGTLPAMQALAAGLKLLVLPAATLGLGRALGLEPTALAVAVVFMALPASPTSYVVARAMGGDAPLMAAIISTEHVASALTLPLWIALLAGLG